MRRFAVVGAVLAVSLIAPASAAAATTTASGTYSGTTEVSGHCLPFDGVTSCDFAGTGTMTGTDQNGDPWTSAYQTHLEWVPIEGCASVSGDVWFAPGWTDPQNPPVDGVLVATIDPTTSTACDEDGPAFATTVVIHLEGTVTGMGAGPWEDASGTFELDGTMVFDFGPSVDSGTFSTTYTVPDPLPTSPGDCDGDDWRSYGVFKNRGDCVSFVATDGKNEPGQNVPN